MAVDTFRRIVRESTQSWVVPCLVRQTSGTFEVLLCCWWLILLQYEHLPPAPRNPTHRHLTPQDSYSLLLAYQSSAVTSHSSFDLSAASRNPIDQKIASSSSDQELSPEWHQIVDKSFCESLDKMEQRRQGLWWEIIKGEREYVRDMDTMYHVSSDIYEVRA